MDRVQLRRPEPVAGPLRGAPRHRGQEGRHHEPAPRGAPELLGKLRRTVGVPLRIILVVRNPYDNVATLSKRLKFTVDQALEQYVAACRTIADVRGQLAEDEHAELRHEDLIAAPQASLARLCAFLDVDAPADYLDDCASILFDAPHRSRDDEAWSGSQRSRLDAAIERFPFLHGYAFDA